MLHANSIRWAIGNGLKTYDFLRGDEHYKYSFGAVDRRIAHVIVSTRSGSNLNGSLDPASLDLVFEKVTQLHETNQLERAMAGCRQILEASPSHVTALRRYGIMLTKKGQNEDALGIFERLVSIDPSCAGDWGRLGHSRLVLAEFKEAEFSFRKASELSAGQTIISHYSLGCALKKQGKHSEAEVEFDKVMKLKPRNKTEVKQLQSVRQILAH